MNQPIITVLIPVKNESPYLDAIFADLLSQTYPHNRTEVIFVDNASDDDSSEKIERFRLESDFEGVIIHKNNSTNFMLGLNQGVALSKGEYIIRWDAHGSYPPEYNLLSANRLAAGANACGGNVAFLVPFENKKSRLLLAAEMSPFCSGGSQYRRLATEPHSVHSVSHPSYRRDMLQKSGLWDKRMVRCEDNELHERICRLGGTIILDPAISSSHYIRPDFKAILLQKRGNGEGISRLLFYARDCISLFYLAPLFFLCSVVLTLVLCAFGIWLPAAILAVAYLSCAIYFAAKARLGNAWRLPGMFFCLHMAYGWGTLCGIFKCLLHPERSPQIDYLP